MEAEKRPLNRANQSQWPKFLNEILIHRTLPMTIVGSPVDANLSDPNKGQKRRAFALFVFHYTRDMRKQR